MATSDELKKAQELNKLLEEDNENLRKRNKLQSEGYDMSSSLVESLKEVLGIRTRQTTFEQDILNTNKEINKSILTQRGGLQDLQSTKIQIRKNNDLISKASVLQLGLEKSIHKEGIKLSQNYVERLSYQRELENSIEEQNKRLQKGDEVAELQLKASKEYLAIVDQQNTQQFTGLSNLQKQYAISVLNTKELQKQTEERKKDKEMLLKLQASMGIAGALVKTLATIPGLGDAAAKAFEDVERKLKADAEATGKVASRWKTFGMIASETSKHLGQALTDPAVILTSIFTTYLDINKASVELSHLTGQNAVKFENIGLNAASLKDSLEIMAELTKRTGMNAQNIFSSKVIGQAAALKTTMGLTADEAGGLAIMSQTTGKNVDDIVESVVATTSAFNGANRAAVSQGAVLREVANTSDSIKLSLGNNPESLTKAAAAATRLGLSLQEVDNIASSLTDFQSSISNELEAELLIGKDLNLEKARELALNNDLEGVSKELFKNSSDIAEFGKMNRIQQESYAKALGMTKDQLAKMAYNKGLEAHMTEEQAAAAAGVNAEDMKRVAMQENFAKALEKISGALAPILDIVGDILSMPFAPYILMAGFAVTKLGGSLTGVSKGFGGMYKAGKDAVLGVADLFKKGGLTTAISKLKGAFGEGTGDMVKSKSGKLFSKDSPQGKMITNLSGKTDKAGEVATDAKEKLSDKVGDKAQGGADKISGKEKGGFQDSMKDIAGGLKAMGAKGVLQGVVNLALAGPALVVAVASIPFLLTVSAIGKAAGVGLRGLASGLSALGKAGTTGFIGVGLIAALGVAMIPFGYALGLAAPAIEAFGTVLLSVFQGLGVLITAAADGFVTLMGAVTMENVGPMLLLGPALFGIAAGLAAIAIAGPMAIPALLAVTGLAVVAGGVATIFGAGESKSAGEAKGKGEEGSLAVVEAKLTELIAAVKAGGNVYMDSNKVGKASVLGTYKS